MKISRRQKWESAPLHKLPADRLIGKMYFLKYCIVKNKLAQDIFKETRKEEGNNSNIQWMKSEYYSTGKYCY